MNAPARQHSEPGVGISFLKLGAGEAAARIIAFGATVYLARTLGASTYGVIVLATTVLLYLSVLTDCGVDMLGIREVAADRSGLFHILPEVLGARFLVGAGLALLTVVAGLTVLPRSEGTVLALYSLTLVTVGLGTRWVHLGLQQAGRASFARVLTETVSATLIVAAVRGPTDLTRVPLAQLLGEGLGALLLLRLLPSGALQLPMRLRPTMIRTLLARSWPMVFHALLGLAIFNSDFIFLRVLRNSEALGFYAAAYTLISFFLNLGAAYTTALIPAMTRRRGDPVLGRTLYDASMAQVMAGVIPVCAGGMLIADQIVALIFGTGYSPSAAPLRILLLVLPLAFVRNVSQGALLANGRQDQLLGTVVWAAGANLALNITLIPVWGMAGAAWATVITEGVRTCLAVVFTSRLDLPMTNPRRFTRILAAAGTMAAAVAMTPKAPVFVRIALGVTVYVVVLALLGGVRFHRRALPELTV